MWKDPKNSGKRHGKKLVRLGERVEFWNFWGGTLGFFATVDRWWFFFFFDEGFGGWEACVVSFFWGGGRCCRCSFFIISPVCCAVLCCAVLCCAFAVLLYCTCALYYIFFVSMTSLFLPLSLSFSLTYKSLRCHRLVTSITLLTTMYASSGRMRFLSSCVFFSSLGCFLLHLERQITFPPKVQTSP